MDNMKRHLNIVHTESSNGWGGQEMRILSEAAGFLERGHHITVVCPADTPLYAQAQTRDIPVVSLPIAKKRLNGLFSLCQWLRNHCPDVINTHSSTDSWLVASANKLTGSRASIVRTRHVSVPVARKAANTWLYGRAVSRVVTTGEVLRTDLISQLALPPQHVISVPTGVDLDLFKNDECVDIDKVRAQLSLPEGVKIIGIVATVRSWKGHDDLLCAFEKIAAHRDDVVLLIIGDGPYAPVFKKRVAASVYQSRIHMLGQRQDIPELLRLLDVFVLPSYANEGVPQAIMQAMAMQLPVVSTRVGAIDEIVQHESTGYLVAARDTDDLAKFIGVLLDDATLRGDMGARGRVLIEERFSRIAMLDKMEALFLNCVSEK